MKAIWTLIFLAIIASTVGITMLFVPQSQWTETFWLSVRNRESRGLNA